MAESLVGIFSRDVAFNCPTDHEALPPNKHQPTGYQAFIPEPLPPRPSIELTGELQRLVPQADLALGRLDGSIHTLQNPDLFVLIVCPQRGGAIEPD